MKPNALKLVFAAFLLSDTTWLDGYDIWSCVRVDDTTWLDGYDIWSCVRVDDISTGFFFSEIAQ